MRKFTYEAKKGPGELVKGVIEAESQSAAVDKLSQMGYIPIRVVAANEKSLNRRSNIAKQFSGLSLSKKIRSKELTIFTEQLASLLKSKVPLFEALRFLHEQTENVNLKGIISQSIDKIRDGKTLSESLSKYPKVFPLLYVNMIESGEKGGVLDKTLLRLSEFRNRQEEIRGKVTSALVYPIFMLVVGVASMFVLLTFVIPRMASLFSEIGQTLPLPTRILLSASNQFRNYWYLTPAIIVLGVFVFNKMKEKKKSALDSFKLKLPLIGSFIKKSAIARFARTLALLLASGIPLFQALAITIPTMENEVIKSDLELIHKGIIDGASFEQSMKRSLCFPRFMTNMLAVGEKGGNLEEVLLEVAVFYERETNRVIKVITSLLEPAMILVMGLIIGFIVFAMLLPIFQINLGM